MTFPARRRLASGGALALFISLTGYGAGAGKPAGRMSRLRSHHLTLLDAAEKVHHLGVQRFPHCYAGVEVRLGDCRLIVYRRATPGFDRAVRRSVPDVVVTLRHAEHSAYELNELVEWVRSERDLWRQRGISVIRAAPRHDGSAVEVVVPDAQIRQAAPLLRAHYGRAAVATGCRSVVKVPRQIPWLSRVRGARGRHDAPPLA